VFPLLIWLDAFVEVISPIDWLVEDLLDAKTFHLSFVLEDVVEDALSDRVEIIFVDFIQHCVNEVFNTFLLNSVKVTRDELDDVGQPVLSNGCNDID
jgi:hypothetical protein